MAGATGLEHQWTAAPPPPPGSSHLESVPLISEVPGSVLGGCWVPGVPEAVGPVPAFPTSGDPRTCLRLFSSALVEGSRGQPQAPLHPGRCLSPGPTWAREEPAPWWVVGREQCGGGKGAGCESGLCL